MFLHFCPLGECVLFGSLQGVSFGRRKVLFYAILFGALVRWEWKPFNSLSQGKRNVGSLVLPRLCVTPSPQCWGGLGFVRGPTHLKRDSACSLQDPPSCCIHRNIIRKDETSTNSFWILKGELSEIKKAGKMRDSLSIERWHGEMERGVNFTMHIVYRVALIKIPSYTGGKHCHRI